MVGQFKGDNVTFKPRLLSTTVTDVVTSSQNSASHSAAEGLMVYMERQEVVETADLKARDSDSLVQYIESSQDDPITNLTDDLRQVKKAAGDIASLFEKVCGAPSTKFLVSYLQKNVRPIAVSAKIYNNPSSKMFTLCTQKKAAKSLPQGSIQVRRDVVDMYPSGNEKIRSPEPDPRYAQIQIFEEVPVDTGVNRSVQVNVSKYWRSDAKNPNDSSKTTRYMASSWDTQRTGLHYYSSENLPKITANKQFPNNTINLYNLPFVQD